jgi:predicted RNase H-like nuclease (RuvC/YqgF family)
MINDLPSRARVRAKMVEGRRDARDEIGLTSSLLRELAAEIERLSAENRTLRNYGIVTQERIERLQGQLDLPY